ncbi:hypothetical protein C8A03DRAFT_13093 [Achaetomium macrosporum]|uniref:Uncharacterized protein n=1 Tax=Achaetomium macrosporum TaxID=79813 RepID=A0AAN7CEI1_9PEZI|nr:hypothetical protein C8A03DRAFT_13093 [Achaetomium macrosporum]
MHIEGTTRVQTISCVCLYLQSDTLRFLPPLSASLANPKECRLPRYLALAWDRDALPPPQLGMGRGAFRSTKSVVLVPKMHILTEALMRIMARDLETRVGSCCVSHFLYIPIYVEKRGILDISLLPELFEEVYKEMGASVPTDVMKARMKLRRNLGVPLC